MASRETRPAFHVYPPLEDLRRGKLPVENYEDTLPLAIDFDHVLAKPERAAIAKLYTAWTRRIVAESRRADDDEGETFHRFDALFVGDKRVQGGAARFIAAHESCLWLVGELAKLRGVVSVAFGEPPVPDTDTPLATAPSSVDEEPPAALAGLELANAEGTRTASLTFAITLFSDRSLQQSPVAVLAAWHRFLALVPPGRLTLWGTETTAPMNRRAVTQGTLGLLDKWLARGAPKREFLAFSIGDEATYEQAPRWAFEVWSEHGDRDVGSFVHLALPFGIGLARADELAELARELFATGAFRSGLAGPCWHCAPTSSYRGDGNGHVHAVELAPTYPGIELLDVVNDAACVGRDGIKNVGWLTLLDARFVAELGGAKPLAKGLPRSVHLEPAGKGVLIRAGAVPTLEASGGERAILARVAPLLARTVPRVRWLKVPHDDAVSAIGFKLRLAPWPELELARAHLGVGRGLHAAAKTGDAAVTRQALARWRVAIDALRAADAKAGTVVDHPAERAKFLADELAHLFTTADWAAREAATWNHALGIELYEAALAVPGAPAELYGHLSVRDQPEYVLRGLIPCALAAKDRATLERHVDTAARRAAEQPDIHHALARAFVFLGDHARALDHVEAAQGTYGDAKSMKAEPSLRAIAKDPRFIAAFKKPKALRGKKRP